MARGKDCVPYTNYDGITLKEKPRGLNCICPLCFGHGYFNYTLDAYGPGQHFQGACSQCNAWGWVENRDVLCIHEWSEISYTEAKSRGIQHYGMCWHVYVCTKCDRVTAQDSSG